MAQPRRAVCYSAKTRDYSLAIGPAPMTSDVLAVWSDSAGHLEPRRSNAGHTLADFILKYIGYLFSRAEYQRV